MLSEKMLDALNGQMNAEFDSAHLYLSMSYFFSGQNLSGMAHWMKTQYEEEVEHAGKIADYINARGGRIALSAIDAPGGEWDSPLAVFEDAYNQECKVTAMIHKLVDSAREEDDKATENFLAWFIDEQVEEEATTLEVVEKMRMIGDATGALFMYDQVLGKRSGD